MSYGRLLALLAAPTRDIPLAEDCLSAAYEQALRRWPTSMPDNPEAWLFTVARNLIIDDRRSARFRKERDSLDTGTTPEQTGPDEVNAALDRLLLGDAIAQLSADHRAVIRRSYYLGWTTVRIAEDLQIAEGTVKSRLHYAMRALRLTLQEMGVTR